MTMKSCFYPLIGDKIFGWMGDLIDMVSILTTLFGVCTSLGLGTRQLNAGFTMINPEINPNSLTIQVTKNLLSKSKLNQELRLQDTVFFQCDASDIQK